MVGTHHTDPNLEGARVGDPSRTRVAEGTDQDQDQNREFDPKEEIRGGRPGKHQEGCPGGHQSRTYACFGVLCVSRGAHRTRRL